MTDVSEQLQRLTPNASILQDLLPWTLTGAAGLSSAVMLAWGLAAAIPILLHVLNRRRQRPISWAAMQLLLQVIEKQAKRVRLEQLLLLALRVMLLLTLGLALAQPFLTDASQNLLTASSRPPQLWIVAVDTSYSMGYRTDGRSRIDAAKLRAAELLAAGEQGDAYALVALSSPARAVIGTPTYDQSAFLTELQRLSVQDTGSDLGAGLDIIEEILRSAEKTEGIPAVTQVVFLSDLGRDTWQSAVDGDLRAQLQKLQEKCWVDIESFADQGPRNVAIRAMRPATSRVIAGNQVQVDIEIECVGGAVERLPVQLEMNGQTVASEYVDIPAGQSLSLRLEAVSQVPGEAILSVAIPDDDLVADNRRDHVIEVRKQFRILVVERTRGAGRMVKLALQSARQTSLIQNINTIPQLELSSVDLTPWDVVVLNDVSGIDQETLGRLDRFVRKSGSLVLLFGPKTIAADWSTNLESESSLLGFRFVQPSDETELVIDPLEYQSPVVAPFFGFPDSGLLTTPIFRVWNIEPSKELVIDLAFTTGAPLIVRHRHDNGWVASVLSAPQDGLESDAMGNAWNAMATWPSFLPLMQQLVQVVVDTQDERVNLLAGGVLQGQIANSAERQQITISRPDGAESSVTTEILDSNGQLEWYYDQTEQHGVYQARSQSGVESFAVNIDPVESDLASVTLAQLPNSTASPQRISGGTDAIRPYENDNRLARVLLMLLLVLLIAESLLAWSLGRRIG